MPYVFKLGGGGRTQFTFHSISADSLFLNLKQRRLWRICSGICARRLHLRVYIFDAEDISGIICYFVILSR